MRPSLLSQPAPLLLLACGLALLPAASRAGAPLPPTKDQQKCITAFGAAAAGVTKARAAENERCLDAFGKGKLAGLGAASLRSCLARDAKGKVAKQSAKLAEIAGGEKCTAAPPVFGLGPGGAAQVGELAETHATALLLDLLSENLHATARSCVADLLGCHCQAAVADGVTDLAEANLASFGRCAKQELKRGAASAGALGACLTDAALPGSVAADRKGKLAKKTLKLGRTIEKRCAAAAPPVFPGQCPAAQGADLADCAGEIARCRSCLSLNATHGLAEDCDLFDDAAADGSCPGGAVAEETLVIASAATPAETPGSPGVVVTSPKLLAQFGGGAFDLNRATYTRYFLRGAAGPAPDAILVLVPGFEGGAGGFKILAENLLPHAFAATGQVLELWAFDRRTHQLEDLAGLDVAEAEQDPQLALDWLFGEALGLSLSPELPRRAEFHDAQGDVPFLATWTYLVHSQDIDAVVEAARAVARDGNVFLGGHSAGTGFAARYAATDFDLAGAGPPEPGYAKLRGLVLLEGGGGSSAGGPPSEAALDLVEARFAGGLFGAVRDGEARCMDGATPCSVASEAADCAALSIPRCVESTSAYAQFLGLSPQLLASAESIALQATLDPDAGQAILQVDQGGVPGNNAVAVVPELGILSLVLPQATAEGLIGRFVDDDGFLSGLASFVAMSVGAEGPPLAGLSTWLDSDEAASFPACPGTGCATPDNGPAPTALPAAVWGQERESIRFGRLVRTFFSGGTNFTDWYYPSSGLSVTSGLPSLDSSALSLDPPLGRGRRDIDNVTQAAAIDVPVIGFGGSNGLTPVPGNFAAFAASIGSCAAPTCDGSTPRLVDPALPSPAFPTFGEVAGGFEVHISEGYSHVDPLAAEDGPENQVIAPLAEFLARNAP